MTHPSSALFKLVEVAKNHEFDSLVDWDSLGITKEQSYVALSETVLSQYNHIDTSNPDNMMLMAAIVHMAVENLILQVELMKRDEEG